MIWRFSGCCGLVVLYAYPTQFAQGMVDDTDLWIQQLLLSELTKDQVEASQKVHAFVQSVGFQRVPNQNLHYLSMNLVNPALNEIPLDEAEEL